MKKIRSDIARVLKDFPDYNLMGAIQFVPEPNAAFLLPH